jgi:DNA-binding transcriptional MerR regulator
MSRDLDIRIRAAKDRGFVVEESGEAVAALTTRSEVAQWIEDRLASVEGELDRERADIEQTIEDMPNVIRAKTGPKSKRFWG